MGSRVIDAMIDVLARLQGATWPPHPGTGESPFIGGEDDPVEGYHEWIDVASRLDDNSSVEWARVGAGAPGRRDERFWIDVRIHVGVPGVDRLSALVRANELKGVVESLFHNDNGDLTPVGAPHSWAVQQGGVREVWAGDTRTAEGYTADCTVSVAVAARI